MKQPMPLRPITICLTKWPSLSALSVVLSLVGPQSAWATNECQGILMRPPIARKAGALNEVSSYFETFKFTETVSETMSETPLLLVRDMVRFFEPFDLANSTHRVQVLNYLEKTDFRKVLFSLQNFFRIIGAIETKTMGSEKSRENFGEMKNQIEKHKMLDRIKELEDTLGAFLDAKEELDRAEKPDSKVDSAKIEDLQDLVRDAGGNLLKLLKAQKWITSSGNSSYPQKLIEVMEKWKWSEGKGNHANLKDYNKFLKAIASELSAADDKILTLSKKINNIELLNAVEMENFVHEIRRESRWLVFHLLLIQPRIGFSDRPVSATEKVDLDAFNELLTVGAEQIKKRLPKIVDQSNDQYRDQSTDANAAYRRVWLSRNHVSLTIGFVKLIGDVKDAFFYQEALGSLENGVASKEMMVKIKALLAIYREFRPLKTIAAELDDQRRKLEGP
jgi:hypothetical protein